MDVQVQELRSSPRRDVDDKICSEKLQADCVFPIIGKSLMIGKGVMNRRNFVCR